MRLRAIRGRRRRSRWTPPRRSPYIARIWALVLVAVLVIGTLVGRLGQLQVSDGPQMRAAAERINTRSVPIPAVRGRILDATGKPLVANGSTEVLTIDPTAIADTDDGGKALIERVAKVVGGDPAQMLGRTKPCGTKGAPKTPLCNTADAVQPIPILLDVSPVKALALLERPEDFPGLAVESVPVRRYPAPDGTNAAQVLGYLGPVNQADLKADPALTAQDRIGRAGLELQYDAQLRGTDGRSVLAVDARGLPAREVERVAPSAGADVRTHLDAAVQSRAETALAQGIAQLRKKKLPATGAAAVVLDASSGAVVAAASNPSYDPSVWSGGISSTDYAALTAKSANQPLLNRVVGQLQPPASTFKGITLPAAIAAGVDPKGSYECSSAYRVGGRVFTNFESAAYGSISMTKALEVSCDTVFYRWAYQQWQQAGGLKAPTDSPDPFASMARQFGIGERTGVDLPGEQAGLLPDRQWKVANWQATRADLCQRAKTGYPEVKDKKQADYLQQVAKENCTDGYLYQPGDAVNFAIGQGSTQVTPLRMAVVYAAIANGGTLWTPQVAAAIDPAGGRPEPIAPKVAGRVTVPAAAQQIERDGLRDVITQPQGTAYPAFQGFPGSYPISGKTGTAEVFGKQATAWFVSYGPKLPSGKQYVVAVMIEQGGTGAEGAAPVARNIWDLLRTKR
ncbi:penicillin-binding protein 2 [Flexivirga meconopsidis]|uniref:penicillin-binding protein 2 n=1 Tax=Flexivirga meconopsidis TaxID=2977121 RepID=UPI002240AE3B|nr:penicillin-binding protein 2 [Flexivirga meconopsidis]